MSDYAIVFARSARKELERLPPPHSEKVISVIERLQKNVHPRGAKKLKGSADLWRVRIGDYNVIYAIDDKRRIVDVLAVRHRKDAYR